MFAVFEVLVFSFYALVKNPFMRVRLAQSVEHGIINAQVAIRLADSRFNPNTTH